jgi:uncharacterized protein YprB with RNaseH-like and TPR domain
MSIDYATLRDAVRNGGYRGGLKAVERNLGLTRDAAIQGVDGFEAVRLWHCYRRGERAALEKLILCNLTDVVNLVELVETAVRLKHERLNIEISAALAWWLTLRGADEGR